MKKVLFLLFAMLSFQDASAQWYNPLYFNFDTIEPVFIDTTLTNNIWQIGMPQKLIFNSAFSPTNAILTDTINPYPQNNISEFIIKTPTYLGPLGGVNFSFWQKYDTDSLLDGGSIYVSLDYGASWYSLVNTPAHYPPLSNPYPSGDTIAALQEVGFTGSSGGWQQFNFYWNYPQTDTLLIKFKFASDAIQTNKEGWMIDSIEFTYDLGIGINETSKSGSYTLSPNPFTDQTTLSFSATGSAKTLYLYNSKGQLVRTIENIESGSVVIRRDNLPKGIYHFALREQNKIIASGKLVAE